MAGGLAYDIGSSIADGRKRVYVRWWCAECGAHEDITISASTVHNPEAFARYAANKGWEADAFNKRHCICPGCIGKRRAVRAAKAAAAKERAAQKAAGDHTTNGEKVVTLTLAPDPSPKRTATPEERARIRAKLDALFDDSKGTYLDNASDQSIGKELDLPWSWVRDLREAAYGPLRLDPELEALKEEVAAAGAKAAAAADEAANARKAADSAVEVAKMASAALEAYIKRKGLVA